MSQGQEVKNPDLYQTINGKICLSTLSDQINIHNHETNEFISLTIDLNNWNFNRWKKFSDHLSESDVLRQVFFSMTPSRQFSIQWIHDNELPVVEVN